MATTPASKFNQVKWPRSLGRLGEVAHKQAEGEQRKIGEFTFILINAKMECVLAALMRLRQGIKSSFVQKFLSFLFDSELFYLKSKRQVVLHFLIHTLKSVGNPKMITVYARNM